MAYEKRVCVLKQVRKGFSADGGALTGAVYAERMGSELTVTPRIAGLSPLNDGKYLLIFWADGRTFCLELNENKALRFDDAPSLREGFAALLCYHKGETQPIAFGRCGAAPQRCEDLIRYAKTVEDKKKTVFPLPPNEIPFATPGVPLAPTVPLPMPVPNDPFLPGEETEQEHEERSQGGYDDEAIAKDNYFSDAADEDAASLQEKEEGAAAQKNEGDAFSRTRGALTYYYSVKQKLDEAFRGEKDERLLSVFPHSEWVKKEDALLGIISEEGIPRYLCVAAEGQCPENMKEHAVYVPLSCFDGAQGVYIVFQDADTGEYIKVDVE